jgi:hypothetical protein
MSYVGYSGVANQANTTDGFALGTGAINSPALDTYGLDVGDGGVVDLYHPTIPPSTPYFILMENSGYVLQEDESKIKLQ